MTMCRNTTFRAPGSDRPAKPSWTRSHLARASAGAVLVTWLASCNGGAPTAIRLEVLYDDEWSLSTFSVEADGASRELTAAHEVLLLVPDVWAGAEVDIALDGLRGDEPYAHGETSVTPELGDEVQGTLTLTLAAAPCEASCAEGSMRCDGDGTVLCERRGGDACTEWSAPTPCPADAPYCSLGACTTTCTDECVEAESRCSGPDEVIVCGSSDSDECLDWSAPVHCAGGEVCTDGACSPVDDCAGTLACDTPPPPVCDDATTLRTFLPTGTCSGGVCAYPSSTRRCPGGCSAGACSPMCTPSAWSSTTVDTLGPFGDSYPGTSIAVDGSDGVHVGYFDPSAGDLRYAYAPSGGSWSITVVDSAGVVGEFPALALDGAGGVHISYYDRTHQDLKYAYKPSGGAWSTTTIDSAGNVGWYSSVAVDASRGVHITYFDYTRVGLKYAYQPSGGGWSTTTVDSAEVGTSTWVAVDDAGNVHVSYYDLLNEDLKYAYKPSGGSWSATTVDSAGTVGGHTAIAVDAMHGVHISYYDFTNGNLKYAHRSFAGSWSTTTIDSAGSVGSFTSIAVDGSRGVHIAYHDATNGDLKYAYKPSTGSWSTTTVDSTDYVGVETSIALDRSSGIHISHYDYTHGALRYSTRRTCP